MVSLALGVLETINIAKLLVMIARRIGTRRLAQTLRIEDDLLVGSSLLFTVNHLLASVDHKMVTILAC